MVPTPRRQRKGAAGAPVGRQKSGAPGPPWIAWQVPSPAILAAAPPGLQRQLLKDALLRNLDANSLRMQPAGVNALLRLPQAQILAALAGGPGGCCEGAAALRAGLLPAGRQRGRIGRL